MDARIGKNFYLQPAVDLAKKLLGKYILRRDKNGRIIKGRIIETEAYIGPQDKAAHSYKWKITDRNRIEYQEGGYIYIYLVYGMYWQLNITAAKENQPECVLIRALDPVSINQELKKRIILTNGPGKVCRYLKLDKSFYGENLTKSNKIWLKKGGKIKESEIISLPRVGIDYAGAYWARRKLRFLIRDYLKFLPHVENSHKR